jgi:DNA invertase Pin-like site-specific DNA recombinase
MGKRATTRRVVEAATVLVGIYCRVSTEDQAEDDKTSLDDQERDGRAEADHRDWSVVEVYREAYTGTRDNRRKWRQLLADAKAGKINVVIVTKWNRFARNTRVGLELAGELERAGCYLVVLETNFDMTTPTGRYMRTNMLAMAELDHDETVDKLAKGQHGAARKNNTWPCGKTPYGYRLKGGARKDVARATLVHEESEHAILRDSYEWIVLQVKPLSTAEVAMRLNAQGRLTRDGLLWNSASIRQRLTSESLLGVVYWGKTTGKNLSTGRYGEPKKVTAEPILTQDEFDALQRVLALTARRERHGSRTYPLSGRTWCPCGTELTGAWRRDARKGRVRDTIQYRCKKTRWNPQTRKSECDARRIEAEWLESVVWAEVVKMLGTPEQLHALFEKYTTDTSKQPDENSEKLLRTRLEKIKRALDRANLERLMADDPDEYNTPVTKLREDLRSAQRELDAIEATRTATANRAKLTATLANLAEAAGSLEDAAPEERAEILNLLDVRVDVLDKTVDHPQLRVTGMINVAELTGCLTEPVP